MTSLAQPGDSLDRDTDSGTYPGPICGILPMMGWGIESIGCQGCLREGGGDKNGWRFVGECLMPGIALGSSNIGRGMIFDIIPSDGIRVYWWVGHRTC